MPRRTFNYFSTPRYVLLATLTFGMLVMAGCSSTERPEQKQAHEKEQQNITSTTFNTLLDSIWAFEQSGKSDDLKVSKIPNISPQKLAADAAQYQSYIALLNAIDLNQLSHEEQITHTIQLYRLQNYVDEYRYNAHFVPLTSEYGFHSSLLNLYYRFDFSKNDSIIGYLNTLQDIPAYFEQQMTYMRQGMAVGQVQPQAVMQGFEQSVASVITDNVLDSPFYQPFLQLERDDPSLDLLKAQAMRVITSEVNQAYQRFYEFLVNEYIPRAKTDIAVKTWPNGTGNW